MKDIPLRTAEQLGSAIRLKRSEKGLSQAALAELLGVERKWVLRLEAGNPRAELGLVLKALEVLEIQARLAGSNGGGAPSKRGTPAGVTRLDEVFRRLERPKRK